ncbi:F-box/LRR-repeat MAX2 homolog [Phragmites australis]|uniref:F-box/LRR-repeat MAX2 homolog n=1 Tax=Phragmites australis TaxID=29695 RepID=UPI002D78580E|nr:F-box/LRR-repeat MAX2 homolog [Phragmites australis]XP_062233586.1 F-box/LRR-repeat MAX2 homolog [Phragmites australis]XP_062233587.1 F-box/LRR-repeat MAX2 homolog [Phragmites australis]XP_062233588.1 F-box/LRR-repeat MAX2 homolog [Phragmites australis]
MAEAAAAAGSPILDLPEPLLLHILGFLTDARSRHRAALACHRLLAAERTTRPALSLRGNPRSADFLLLPPAFCFPALEHLDLSLVSPWGHPFLSAAPADAAAAAPSHNPEEVAEQNAFIAARLAHCFPAVSSLAVYCRDPSTLESLTQHWQGSLRSVKLVRWHQRPPGLASGADLEQLLATCPALRALDLSEFYCWTEDIEPALAAHPTAAAALTELDLGLAGATDGFHSSELGAIAGRCPNLRKLVAPCVFNPRYVDFVGDDALLSLAASCPKLTVLRLREPFEAASTSQREDAAITVAGLVAFFAALPGLEDFTLDLRHNVLEAAPAMEALAHRCPRIKFLTLGCFQSLCKASWLHLDGVAVCGALESLCMKNCQDLTDASLAAIGRGCGKLSKFAIHGCDLVTSVGIRRLVTALRPTIKEISILHCRLLDTAACLTALSPIRDRIESLEINCVWKEVEQPDSVANGTTGCDPDDDELGEVSYESASKKCRYMELDDLVSWEMLRSLSLWFPAGELLSPLISAGLDSCPALEEISIKVEGDCRTCPRPAPRSFFGLSDLAGFPVLSKMKLDLSEAVGYALTAPAGQMDLSLWERFYLQGIDSLHTLYELDYWPPQDKEVNQRSLTLPAVGLLQRCIGLRKLFVHGTTHEHFLTFFLTMPNLRDMQLREDYYPAPEHDMMITEMRAESWLRFEMQLNIRTIDD